MRKLIAGLLAAGLLLLCLFSAFPARAAYEEPVPEGQLVSKRVGLAYFVVWRQTDGRWLDTDRDGKPDRPGQTKTWTHAAAGGMKLGSGWRATGVRVRFLDADTWTEALYREYGGYKGLSFEEFDNKILSYSAGRCREGRVWAEERDPDYVLHYEGIRLANQPGVSEEQAAKANAMDLKRPKERAFVQSLGMSLQLPPGATFDDMHEGYVWWVPYLVEVYGVPVKPDLYVKRLDPGASEVEEGRRCTGTVVFGLKSAVSEPVKAKLELTHNGCAVSPVHGQVVTFNPGEEKSFAFSFTGQDRDSVLEAKIRPVEGDDADWSNNARQVRVPLRRTAGTGPGSLTFQAVSQTGKYTRPPGTAKWTDWVTATLKPPAPIPPRGSLDWWEITEATLTYPKKHPDFTFG